MNNCIHLDYDKVLKCLISNKAAITGSFNEVMYAIRHLISHSNRGLVLSNEDIENIYGILKELGFIKISIEHNIVSLNIIDDTYQYRMEDIRRFDMTIIYQKEDWDCGVCCVAMAAECSYEEALSRLGGHKRPYYPGEIARAVGTKALPYDYNGTIEHCIVQIGIDRKFPHHYIWVNNGLFCPAGKVKQWGQITGIGKIIPVPLTNK